MIWSTPFVTEYESQYGPPQFAHEPIEITYFGSGICSYRRLIAGAILSVTVPEMTTWAAWAACPSPSGPPQHPLPPRVDQSEREDHDEDHHLDEGEGPQTLEID